MYEAKPSSVNNPDDFEKKRAALFMRALLINPSDVQIEHSDFRHAEAAAQGKNNKPVTVAALIFSEYARLIQADPTLLPDEHQLEEEYEPLARFLVQDVQNNPEGENQILLEFIDEFVMPWRKLSPIIVGEKVVRLEPFATSPKIALLMTKLWVLDATGLADDMPTSFSETRLRCRAHAQESEAYRPRRR